MTNSKSTKRALLTSVLAMLLCVLMLVGTTFAWFTDSASTGVNKIQAGNLKMEVSYKNNATTDFEKVDKNTPVLNNGALWEPGHVEYAVLKIENVGTLALKYKLGINIASETGSTSVLGNEFKLSDYIKFAVLDGDKSALERADLVAAAETAGSQLIKAGYTSNENHLLAKAAGATENPSNIVTLVVWMPDSVGNEANYAPGKTAPVINLGINVVATQLNSESDSFGPDYDKDAKYPVAVSTADELATAVQNGGMIVLKDNINLNNQQITVPNDKEVLLDLNGKTVTFVGNNNTSDKGNSFIKVDGGKLTLTGGAVNASKARAIVYATNGGVAVIDGGKYTNTKYIVLSAEDNGTVIVNGGEFTSQESICFVKANSALTINGGTFTAKDNAVISANGNSGNGNNTITINGGVFNANIQSPNYIACGIYVANNDTVNVNGGTFNVTDGVGILMRAGKTTIGKDVVINLTNTGNVSKGKVGDAPTQIEVGKYLVSDVTIPYPGTDDTFTITNNSSYALVEYK